MTRKTTTYSIQGKASFQSKISGGACFTCVVVRRFLLFLLLFALLTPLSTLFSSCGHDDLVPPDVYVEELEPPYVELRIAVPLANPTATRSNPMGGEEGNGRERGVLHEDEIHDINVFFYIETSGLGMDSPDGTIIIKHIYYNFDNSKDGENSTLLEINKKDDNNAPDYWGQRYVYLRFQCTEEEMNLAKAAAGINFVAVANSGKLQCIEGETTLGEVRGMKLNYKQTSTWTTSMDVYSVDASKMNYFLMSTAYNEDSRFGSNKIKLDGNEYTGTTTLQRMYARLDLWYNYAKNAVTTGTGSETKVKELKYGIVDTEGKLVQYTEKDAAGNEINKDKANVYITNVLPVNVMQSPSYLFKRVTDFGSFTDWTTTGFDGKTSFKWGGKESPNDLPTATSPNDRPTNYVMEWHTKSKLEGGESPKDSLDTWYGKSALSNVLVNIDKTNIDDTKDGHFSAYYHMNRSAGEYDPDYDCNHISIISYANENTHPTNCFHSNYLTGMAFRAVYVPDKIYSGSTKTTGADGMTKVVATEWQTADGAPTKIYRYSPSGRDQKESESLYFTNRTEAEKYSEAHPEDNATISKDVEAFTAIEHVVGKDADGNDIKKWGLVCYYNVWLRHYNNEADDPQTTYPMEYATVRNNIYRLAVTFSGPGDPEPTMREPDTMKARIFVRKWNYKEEPEIIF